MTPEVPAPAAFRARFPGLLTIAFATTVALWSVAYFGRLPTVMLHGALLVVAMLGCLAAGGAFAARTLGGGFGTGAWVGALSGLLNLLILGSLLTGDAPNRIVPSALIWIPGSLAASAAAAGLAGVPWRGPPAKADPRRWLASFARVSVVATALLIAAGGVVTSQEMGLAVVDWPNSYGYNMFLFPLSKMVAGVYFEHAHRLFGALVGLTVLVLAIFVWRVDGRRAVRALALGAFALVVAQGVFGGLRVTGRLTMELPETTEPSILSGVIHGVLAQIVFSLLVWLAAVVSKTWREGEGPRPLAGVRFDRIFGPIVLAAIVVQLVLGAIQRHTQALLMIHVAMGTLVAPLAVTYGFRSWGRFTQDPLLRRLGIALVAGMGGQVFLGLGSFLAIGALGLEPYPKWAEVLLTTLHQWFGAVVFAVAASLVVWSVRRTVPIKSLSM